MSTSTKLDNWCCGQERSAGIYFDGKWWYVCPECQRMWTRVDSGVINTTTKALQWKVYDLRDP